MKKKQPKVSPKRSRSYTCLSCGNKRRTTAVDTPRICGPCRKDNYELASMVDAHPMNPAFKALLQATGWIKALFI